MDAFILTHYASDGWVVQLTGWQMFHYFPNSGYPLERAKLVPLVKVQSDIPAMFKFKCKKLRNTILKQWKMIRFENAVVTEFLRIQSLIIWLLSGFNTRLLSVFLKIVSSKTRTLFKNAHLIKYRLHAESGELFGNAEINQIKWWTFVANTIHVFVCKSLNFWIMSNNLRSGDIQKNLVCTPFNWTISEVQCVMYNICQIKTVGILLQRRPNDKLKSRNEIVLMRNCPQTQGKSNLCIRKFKYFGLLHSPHEFFFSEYQYWSYYSKNYFF